MSINKIFLIILIFQLPISFIRPFSVYAFEDPSYALINKINQAEEKAQLQRAEAEKKAKAIDTYYRQGKASYQRGDYAAAIVSFEELLKTDPSYEPAKLYLECAILQQKIEIQKNQINSIKLKMADIIAEFEGRIKTVEGLGLGYLLEQALLRCQASDFTGAEYYYSLCYKIDPKNEDKIEWFVSSTYKLENLSASLNNCYNKIEELSGA